LDEDTAMLKVIEKSREKGHEFYPHGYQHDPFECGFPESYFLTISENTRASFDSFRFEQEAKHTFDTLVTMFENSNKIWYRAFSEHGKGFRPPYGSFCLNLYKALKETGYSWTSSRFPCLTSWRRGQGEFDEEIDFRNNIPLKPCLVEGVMELPIAGEYTWHVINEEKRMEQMVELALDEFEIYRKNSAPMVLITHFHSLQFKGIKLGVDKAHPEGTGYEIHRKLLPQLQKKENAEFVTMNELFESVSCDW